MGLGGKPRRYTRTEDGGVALVGTSGPDGSRNRSRLQRRRACIRHPELPRLVESVDEEETEPAAERGDDGGEDAGPGIRLAVIRSVPPETSRCIPSYSEEPRMEPEPETEQRQAQEQETLSPLSMPATPTSSPLKIRLSPSAPLPNTRPREPKADLALLSDYDLGLLHEQDHAGEGTVDY